MAMLRLADATACCAGKGLCRCPTLMPVCSALQVGLGEGLAPSSATNVMARLIPEWALLGHRAN